MGAAIRNGRCVVRGGAVSSARFFAACRCGVVGGGMVPVTALIVRFVYLLRLPCGRWKRLPIDKRQVRRWNRWNNAAFAVFFAVLLVRVLFRIFGR